MNKRGIFTALAWSLLTCSLGHAQDKGSQPVLQLMGGGEVAQWTGEPLEDPALGENTIEWRYPVFKGGDKAALVRLNAWTRTVSLEGLFSSDNALLKKTILIKDSGVLALLAKDKTARESAMIQSRLIPTRRFFRHITFDHHSEMLGLAHTTHGVTHRVFDYKTGREVPIASLFKSSAASELGGLLMDEIARSIKKMNKANRPDTKRCQHQRSFEWHTVSIQSSTEIAIEFPYSSGNDCGEGYYILSGPTVKKLFLSPQDFSKGETL